jgi:signal transduction histidine kinase
VRIAGFAVWLAVGSFLPLCTDRFASPLATTLLFLAFGVLFYFSSLQAGSGTSKHLIALLVAQTVAALLLLSVHPYFLMTGLFVIVGWQVALSFPRSIALCWILVQSVAAGIFLHGSIPTPLLASSLGAAFGFQVFALATAEVVRSERTAQGELACALQAVVDAQEDKMRRTRQAERLRIARDLHDELGHELTALGLLAAAAEVATPDEAARGKVARVKTAARDLLERVRSVVSTMRIEANDADGKEHIDLGHALHAIRADESSRLALALTIAGDLSAVPRRHAVALLRLVQEAHTNALRHAGTSATNLAINVTRSGSVIDVVVLDDGDGASQVEFGNGLTGMRARLDELGGLLEILGRPGRGFQVMARLPLEMP